MERLKPIHSAFLQLVRLGIGTWDVNDSRLSVPDSDSDEWEKLKALADKQGLTAVVMDGLISAHDNGLIDMSAAPPMLWLEWLGDVLLGYEKDFQQYEHAIGSLAGFYNQHGFKMMVLKGYACSLDWPKPNHRPCGDIDIWMFGQQKEADEVLASSIKIQDPSFKIDNSHHHHTAFLWQDFAVENHYDFFNVYARESNKEMEVIFKELGNFKVESSEFLKGQASKLERRVDGQLKECSDAGCKIQPVKVRGEVVYLPSADLHALFLMRHMMAHFVGSKINLRQVLDWAFFAKKHTQDIDWQWLVGVLERFHMKDFFDCINVICVDDLGFDKEIFPCVEHIPMVKERVLNDILSPEFSTPRPKNLLPRLVFRYKRWQSNEWKQRLCFSESRWKLFWKGLWAKALKPASL